jgi:hypothetical protein
LTKKPVLTPATSSKRDTTIIILIERIFFITNNAKLRIAKLKRKIGNRFDKETIKTILTYFVTNQPEAEC